MSLPEFDPFSLLPGRKLAPAPWRAARFVGGDMCWSAWCEGCGRALVSATWRENRSRRGVYCTAKCKADHGA